MSTRDTKQYYNLVTITVSYHFLHEGSAGELQQWV